ncbi:MAG: hypothetical protein WD359_10760 [Dehalococcoidia bacterium]
MGTIIDQVEGKEQQAAVRCPVCGRGDGPGNHCPHVRWAFEQGDPLDFAKYAMQASPYVRGRGHKWTDIPAAWWTANGDWIIAQIDVRLHIGDGYVFGELGDLDLLARDVWKAFSPDHQRTSISRVDL